MPKQTAGVLRMVTAVRPCIDQKPLRRQDVVRELWLLVVPW